MNNRIKPYGFFAGIKTFLVFAAMAFAFTGAFAQVKFSISAPSSVPVNQAFQLNLTVENANGGNPRLGSMPDFQLVGGPSTQTNMSFINGSVSQSVTYSYILKPKQEGTFKIGKASITVNGVNMESNELTVNIGKAQQQQQQQQRAWDPFADPFGQQQQQQQQEPEVSQGDLVKQLKDGVFLRLEVSKGSAYEGEMLTATYKLYIAPNLGLSISKMDKIPAFEGFLSQEVEMDPKRQPTTVNYNGKQFKEVDLFKYNLYPQRSGSIKIPSAEVGVVAQVQVRSRSRGFFDDFFNGGRVQQVPLDLNDVGTVNIKPLPENGKPADFSGAVGKFNFETSVSGKQGKTDDPITYTVKIVGTGNLKLIEAPVVKMPPSFEVYDPKSKENITNGPAGLTGSKQYDYLLIPRQPGEYKIDSRAFSYFDPSAGKKYVTINSPEYPLTITGAPSKNMNSGVTATTSKQDISLMGQDIRYIKTNAPQFTKSSGPFFGSAGFVTMYSAPVLLFFLLIGLRRRSDAMAADVIGSKRRRALKLAKKRLSVAEKYFKTDDKKAFYDEVSRAMWGYLGDKLNIDMAGLSKENVEEKLQARSVKPETIAKLKGLITTCEMALYAPVSDEHSEMKKNYDAAMNLIADLEDEVKA